MISKPWRRESSGKGGGAVVMRAEGLLPHDVHVRAAKVRGSMGRYMYYISVQRAAWRVPLLPPLLPLPLPLLLLLRACLCAAGVFMCACALVPT